MDKETIEPGIVLSETSDDFKKGFIFATKCIFDMGLSDSYQTKEDFLKQINDFIFMIVRGEFFPKK